MPGEIRAELAIRPAPISIRSSNINGRSIGASSPNGIPSAINIPIVNGAVAAHRRSDDKRHKHARSSYSEASSLVSRNNSFTFRPAKRSMPAPGRTIAIINASGRQAASLIRYATAVGYHVRAQMRNRLGVIATEVATNENVTVLEGELYTRLPRSDSDVAKGGPANNDDVDVTRDGSKLSGIGVNHQLISELFRGAQLAFINTTFYGDEIKIGEALADAAKRAGIQHFVFSSMPDHNAYSKDWPSLPLWATKHKVEEYVSKIGLNATFVYTGIYNNNFTSLKYPLFCMDLQPDGSFLWQAPFHPDAKLPWLDAEHDVGPAILQVFKDGVAKWGGGKRIALAYEMLSPREACRHFARGVGRPVRYRRGPIEVKVPIPAGYRSQLKALERLFMLGGDDPKKQPPYFGDHELDDDVPTLALELWEDPATSKNTHGRSSRLEEQANGLTWMLEDEEDDEDGDTSDLTGTLVSQPPQQQQAQQQQQQQQQPLQPEPIVDRKLNGPLDNHNGIHQLDNADEDEDDEEEEEDCLVMRTSSRKDEEWLP